MDDGSFVYGSGTQAGRKQEPHKGSRIELGKEPEFHTQERSRIQMTVIQRPGPHGASGES